MTSLELILETRKGTNNSKEWPLIIKCLKLISIKDYKITRLNGMITVMKRMWNWLIDHYCSQVALNVKPLYKGHKDVMIIRMHLQPVNHKLKVKHLLWLSQNWRRTWKFLINSLQLHKMDKMMTKYLKMNVVSIVILQLKI